MFFLEYRREQLQSEFDMFLFPEPLSTLMPGYVVQAQIISALFLHHPLRSNHLHYGDPFSKHVPKNGVCLPSNGNLNQEPDDDLVDGTDYLGP